MLWLDGQRIDGDTAMFDLRDRGLLLGDGLFDTSFILNGRIVFAGQHLGRLATSCATFGIPFDRSAIEATASQAASEIEVGSLRITVSRGPAPRGLLPPPKPAATVIMAAHPGKSPAMWKPLRTVATSIRRNETSPTSRHKCLSYVDAIVALDAASRQGADDVIFQNTAGHAVCCSTGNLFVLHGDILRTPPIADGVLPGVVRNIILDLAPNVRLVPVEASLTLDDLWTADAVFTTNSLRLISPITAFEGRPLSTIGLGKIRSLALGLLDDIHKVHGVGGLLAEALAAWPVTAG